MPTSVGAYGARISHAAPWINGPNVILSQCCSNRSRSSSSRLASSVGREKTSTVAPSGSVTRSGRFSAVIQPTPHGSPHGYRGIEGDPQSGEYTQPRAQEADRVLIMPVEQIVDLRISGQQAPQFGRE